MRAIVIGASSGLGRCIATDLGQQGASVALLARREDRLAEAAKDAGDNAFGVRCDVTDEASCRDAVAEAASGLGGVDAFVYATGVGILQRLEDLDAAAWRHTLDTNVVGAAIATAAVLPHLAESGGAAAYLSTVQASVTPPWPGLGSYAVSKAALDKLVEAWRIEHPTVGFTQVVVGECGGGEGDAGVEFSAGFDRDLAVEVAPIWMERNYMSGSLLDVGELVTVVNTVLRCGASARIPSVTVVPRPPA